MTNKAASKATKTSTLTINHFGVEHTIPFAAISELKVGAFQHGTATFQPTFVGQVLVLTNAGKEYYLYQQVEADQETALANANEFATGLKTTLGWTAAVELAVTALV